MNQTKRITLAGLFLALAIVFQLLGRSYPDVSRNLVGPLINMLLLLCVWYCGLRYGLMLSILTPLTALLVGQLNPVMAPFMPFIMIGNALLVLAFHFFRNHLPGRIIGIILGAIIKYFFMSLSVRFIAPSLGLPDPVLKNMAFAFGTVQLIAALIGGLLAMIVIELLDKRVRS